MNKIIVKQTHIEVPNYTLGDCPEIEKMLSVWDDDYHKLVPVGFSYNEETNTLILPRGMDLSYIERKFNMPLEIDRNFNKYKRVSYKLKTEPRDDNQVKSIAYLLGEGEFTYTKRYSQQALNLDMGQGKTYVTIASGAFLQMATLVITHINTIKNQWMSSYLEFTNIDEQYMYDIRGSKCIDKLLKETNPKYKVYFVNHDTIKAWCRKNGWNKLNDVFNHLGIGLKIYDEAHLEFSSLLNIDFNTNVYKTFYLTATFERGYYTENKVFYNCFKNIAKFGVEINETLRKHIVYIAVKYNTRPNIDEQIKIKGRKGFDRYAYIDYQIKKGKIFDVVKYVSEYFKNQEGKLAILTSKIESSFIFEDYMKELYPDKRIISWNSQVPDEIKETVNECDVISSTPKSLGTGNDIPGLRFMIMTEPYTSNITAKQVPGRLREYGPDMYTFYVELIDIGFSKVNDMYRKRLKKFKEIFVSINEINYEKINKE